MTKTNNAKTPTSKRRAPASKRAAIKAKKPGCSTTQVANGKFAASKSAIKKSNQAAKLLQDKRVVAQPPLRASNSKRTAKKSNRAVQNKGDDHSSTMDHDDDAYRTTTKLEPSDVVFSRWAMLFKTHPGTNDYLDMVHDCCFALGKIQERTKENIDEMVAKLWDFVVDEKQGRFLSYVKTKGFGLLTAKEARNKIKGSLGRYRKYYFLGSPEAYKTGPRIRGDASDDDDDDESGDDESSNNGDTSTDCKVIRFAPKKNDIIYGTSNKRTMDHPGNVFYHSLVQKYFPKLEKANDPTKEQYKAMSNEIMQVVVHQRKGRFLRPTDHKGRFERKSEPNYCVVLAPTVVEYKVRCALYKHRSWFRKNMLPDSNDNDDDGSLPPPKTTRKPRRGHSLNPHENMVGPDDSDSEHSFGWSEDSDDEDNEEEGDEEEGDEEEGDEDDDDDKEEGDEDDNNQLQYGSQRSEMEMRRWLKQHLLPQSVGDTLVMHRVRDLNHVRLAVEVESDYLAEKLRASDFAKLCRAVESMDGNGA